MMYKSLLILAGISATLAVTPEGFEPAASSTLLVSFGSVSAESGNVLAKDATQTAPSIGTESQLTGSSFAVLMIDLDIPTNSPPATNTLLHWMQTGLTQSTTATPLGSTNAFLFQNSSGQTAFAEYLGPAPPARIPLSHRYTQIVVDTSDATEASLSVLQSAAASRMGFNALAVLTQAGLESKVLAGNFFNVTNPGPVASTTGSANSSNSTSGGSFTNSTGTGSVTKPTPTPTQSPIVPGAAMAQKASGMLLGIAIVGAVFVTL
ncbi:PEBP-like protein [Hypoxylon rubiginosum]|uniref:PEBP-like protein n=1 Tax=Hypoxylon rubiginosum TaxID=110542 RepID=A0ACB9Z7G0_9PEZI|nr:PEBP-like protein [Hypoxylon rubiginosum]